MHLELIEQNSNKMLTLCDIEMYLIIFMAQISCMLLTVIVSHIHRKKCEESQMWEICSWKPKIKDQIWKLCAPSVNIAACKYATTPSLCWWSNPTNKWLYWQRLQPCDTTLILQAAILWRWSSVLRGEGGGRDLENDTVCRGVIILLDWSLTNVKLNLGFPRKCFEVWSPFLTCILGYLSRCLAAFSNWMSIV